MPKLWDETIDAHRNAVRDAALDATAVLVGERGLAALTMSRIAERAGMGRATLYKYFPDLQAVLTAWHERQVNDHLAQLAAAADPAEPVATRLRSVLHTYAMIQFHSAAHRAGDLAVLLHSGPHVDDAVRRLRDFLRDLIDEGVQAEHVRTDAGPDELADFCLHALTAAGSAGSAAGVDRLVTLTLSALQPD
ncbi:TetR/AcrR family transcriptional regulator [Actinomadura harenae]|uniref:TetR/AcrR family transcriptional regulator n=1 Tax=Actinomadura harenae TaxID=2483351 RepID=A0A3M2M6M3_9ACTN|nr:TetR/AcrR family transcriptional regulator [Actinomadura harenae]RMI45454.1 TetR/AcrR family transcriptional regulator [Actinomadura harenae]